jgi:hypothetical protein
MKGAEAGVVPLLLLMWLAQITLYYPPLACSHAPSMVVHGSTILLLALTS